MGRRPYALAAALLAGALLPSSPRTVAQARPLTVALPFDPLPFDRGASGLGLALRRLGTTGRVLYVTAHPDDEDNAALVALSRGRGLHVTLFTLTRGAGGLNEIGPELFQELSVLRTAETAERARYDAVEQRFGRADDFGYSFSVEECVERWGRQEMLEDVVAVMRRLRPDVVLTLPLRNAGGGAAHSASAQLAAEAFPAAADPQRFAASGLQPWQARALYEGGVGGSGPADTTAVTIETAAADPLLGMSWAEVGSLARARHRSQGTRQVKAPLGEGRSAFRAALRAPGVDPPANDLFDGLDTTLPGLARRFGGEDGGLQSAQQAAERARQLYDARRPEAVLPALEDGLRALGAAAAAAETVAEPARSRLLDRIAEEQGDFGAAVALAMGLDVEPLAESADAVAGRSFGVATRVRTGVASPPVEEVRLRAAEGWDVRVVQPLPAAAGEPGTFAARHEVSVPAGARPTAPHWHVEPGAGRNRMDAVADPTLPWPEPELSAVVRVATAAGPLDLEMPVYAARAAAAGGEERTLVRVVPPLSARIDPPRAPFAAGARTAREVLVYVAALSGGAGRATVRLEAPAGWRIVPSRASVTWARAGEEVGTRFQVSAPSAPADVLLRAVAESEGREYRQEWLEVARPHAQSRSLLREAAARAVALDLRSARAARVGYVEGAGDVVAASIEALGVPVRRLGRGDLARGDLSRLTTVVLGVRAYQTRPDLRAHNARLLEFAAAGGHLVVQLSRAEFNQLAPLVAGAASPAQAASPFAPYPGRVGLGRVADETAPLRLLAPGHPLLTAPHRIGPADFAGWVQERGSFLFEAADPRYVELLAAGDPWPENAGEKKGLLVDAAVGRGSWTYVGLNLFRQLHVGTPGAWRLLANLVARPRGAAAPIKEVRH